MAICPSCDFRINMERDQIGSRCPSCRDPLYEPPSRLARPVKPGELNCAIHPDSESLGACNRCGNQYCETCRCRWFNQVLCSACVKKLILSGSTQNPLEQNKQHRQAVWSLVCGTIAIMLMITIFQIVSLAKTKESPSEIAWAILLFTLFPVLLVTTVFAIGLGSAAIRQGGKHQTMASIGLVLGCISSALWIGDMVWSIWIM